MKFRKQKISQIKIFVSSFILLIITFVFILSIDIKNRQRFVENFVLIKKQLQEGIEKSKLNLDFINTVRYTVFEDSRIPFTFKYPTGWHIKVYLSKDRENYFDRILLANPARDFRIYINSFLSFNPHYTKADEYILENNFTLNPFEGELIRFNSEGFVFIDNFVEPFVISQQGGTVFTFDTRDNIYILKPSFLTITQREFVYQKRGNSLSKKLILGDPDEQTVMTHIVNISFEVVDNAPQLVWFLNRNILIEILHSIQIK